MRKQAEWVSDAKAIECPQRTRDMTLREKLELFVRFRVNEGPKRIYRWERMMKAPTYRPAWDRQSLPPSGYHGLFVAIPISLALWAVIGALFF